MNIVGRITKNAEVNALANDRQVVNFSVAINDSFKNKQGDRVEQTTFYNCSYWISSNVAKILTKGTLVELTGKPSASAWIGKDGEIRSGLNFLHHLLKFTEEEVRRMLILIQPSKPNHKQQVL
jgi:single-strand DNA-binding protein